MCPDMPTVCSDRVNPHPIPEIFSRLYHDQTAWNMLIEWGIVASERAAFDEHQLTYLHEQLIRLVNSLRLLPAPDLHAFADLQDMALIQDPEVFKNFLSIASDVTALICLSGGSSEIADVVRSCSGAPAHELLATIKEWLSHPAHADRCSEFYLGELDGRLLRKVPKELAWLTAARTLVLNLPNVRALSLDCLAFPSLLHLTINAPNLVALHGCVWGLQALKTLHLHLPRVTDLPRHLGDLPKLEELFIVAHSIKECPESIGQLGALHTLTISSSSLSKPPLSIGQLRSLRTLEISANHIEELPEALGGLLALETISLHCNGLHSLQPGIGRLSSMRSLEIVGDSLETLPPEIGHLSKLERMVINGKRLRTLPKEIGRLRSLHTLDVSGVFDAHQRLQIRQAYVTTAIGRFLLARCGAVFH